VNWFSKQPVREWHWWNVNSRRWQHRALQDHIGNWKRPWSVTRDIVKGPKDYKYKL
jgi:hypothetical protein